ncbi:hypothetical protein N7451_012592 [Penicillium sp. IBT 35674x]|nr:hypothetical protein N7451_012592 [Penicillium sp. IBT 35674x]
MYGGDSIDLNAFVAQSTLAASVPLRPASTAKLGLVRRGIERQDDFPLVIRPKAWCSTFQYHDTFFELSRAIGSAAPQNNQIICAWRSLNALMGNSDDLQR